MGLDTSHDCWHGAYSAFDRWRNIIAKAAGYEIWPVKEGLRERDTIILHWGAITMDNVMGVWEKTPDDPIVVILVHSDCEGVIHPAQATPLADRLQEILPNIEDDDSAGHIKARGGNRAVTEKFIAGLRAAAEAGEPVKFG